MSEPGNVPNLLAEAERAAGSGDLASAEELLKEAARLQEKELGPRHPDLANTLNNLGIIAEKAGRPDDAETFYRRAVAIASASLSADDPMVAASRQNLEDFCRAHGRPIDKPVVIEPAAAEPPPPPPPTPPLPTSTVSSPPPPVSRRVSRSPAAIVIGVVALVIAAVFIARPRSPRPTSIEGPAAEPTPAPAAEPARPAADPPAPIVRPPAPRVDRVPARAGVDLVTAQLCVKFSPSGWRCDPAGNSVAPGPIVLYTRVRSPRDGVIVHRWYRGDTLRKSAQLRIGANATEGYRTFSRQIVERGEWRVEVRSAAGDLLHEQRLVVR